jgi:hypothetical protein
VTLRRFSITKVDENALMFLPRSPTLLFQTSSSVLEILRVVCPIVIIGLIIRPSFTMLYFYDSLIIDTETNVTVKITGYQ